MSLRNAAKAISTKSPIVRTQEEAAPGTIENDCGVQVFQLTPFERVCRFLILGSEGNMYRSTDKLTTDNVQNLIVLAKDNTLIFKVLARIDEILRDGLAPQREPCIFALAVLSTAEFAPYNVVRKEAVRIATGRLNSGTDFLYYASYVHNFRGWGSAVCRGVSEWYNKKGADSAAYSILKYNSRITVEGVPSSRWSHADVIRLAHIRPVDAKMNSLFRYTIGRSLGKDIEPAVIKNAPKIIGHYEELQSATSASEVCMILDRNRSLTWEMVPTQFLRDRKVWENLLPNMNFEAMVKKLGILSNLGLTDPFSTNGKFIVDLLNDEEAVKASRMHPIKVFLAQRTYSRGQGDKGSLTWSVNPTIAAALDETLNYSFKNIVPTGKNILMALDVSGSMTWTDVSKKIPLTPAQVCAIMAMATVRSESNVLVTGFGSTLTPLNITSKDTFESASNTIASLMMGGTDISLPMVYATQKKYPVDAFVVYTDSDANTHGALSPDSALRVYRKTMQRPAKLVVCATQATSFSIADPNDPGMLDIAGFDSSTPATISAFIRA
jgi:60 kDa SS-A/Ro ribonucleoprotein